MKKKRVRRVRCIVCKKLMTQKENCVSSLLPNQAHHLVAACCEVIMAWEKLDQVVAVDD